MHSALECIQHH